ncbi:UDP-N-acetylglucosamine 2-epimerase (non-hydrolyzing) [Ornithinimicrobium faecis]|uniref:UDP-N-acetylglucosamine 2-epimerase (non-hydrolyzing) n=1 Tax=Ornithinimicrobium faecis TaxID=2934158 RepID=A0ABY4YSP3_9MICO|nr:UDP-N-acetylglucosamine 2-epimerase (non-hydrolyzing) [Ornithinimicrobium sp. HY1793]USQ79794.1 UDP-N-acetylglucosamine 2-epimerase (non-hydrolyzing) [Ornithinimicrobium sp. HY1793]
MTSPKRVMTIYGTRPEAIKVAPVIKALEASDQFESLTAVTGQHREMLDQVNDIFEIVPDFDLDVFAHGQTLNVLMAKVFERLDPVLLENAPDAVLVQGDTSTVAAASIAAFYRQIPVVHLEAGLRSGNIHSPFPEEANRKITTQVAALHLAPTSTSKANLTREGISDDLIVVTGNTVIDALLHTVEQGLPIADERLAKHVADGDKILLVTTHRRENWGDAMQGVGRALRRIGERYPDLTIVLPAHRNPIVREAVLPHIKDLPNVLVTEPLAYGEFTRVMAASTVVLTDSGGVQEEAPSLGKPVLVMRENTERPEAVEAGTVKLIGTDEERIVTEVTTLLDDETAYAVMGNAVNPYGDGKAAARSVAAISHLLDGTQRPEEFAG